MENGFIKTISCKIANLQERVQREVEKNSNIVITMKFYLHALTHEQMVFINVYDGNVWQEQHETL